MEVRFCFGVRSYGTVSLSESRTAEEGREQDEVKSESLGLDLDLLRDPHWDITLGISESCDERKSDLC